MLSATKSKQENCTETDLEEETKKPAALYLQDKQTDKQKKKMHPNCSKYQHPWEAISGIHERAAFKRNIHSSKKANVTFQSKNL